MQIGVKEKIIVECWKQLKSVKFYFNKEEQLIKEENLLGMRKLLRRELKDSKVRTRPVEMRKLPRKELKDLNGKEHRPKLVGVRKLPRRELQGFNINKYEIQYDEEQHRLVGQLDSFMMICCQ